ncbi:MAG: UDP-N-acetylmuramyl-tripeptide synthetase, partial [Patescibacteria group bacterium]
MNNKANFLGSRITIVGIGGERLFYIAKFLKLMGKEVEGYDYRKSDNTKKLESLGIKIKYSNPGPDFSTDSDLIIYSELLPAKVLRPVLKFRNLCHCERERSNLNTTSGLPRPPAASISLRDRHPSKNSGQATLAMTGMISANDFFWQLTESYQKGFLSPVEKKAFANSGVAPLFQIDCSKMAYIGVTGTDGKTTTATMIYKILKDAGYKPGLITTVSAKIGSKEIDTGFHVTTPPAQETYQFIKQMEKAGCSHAVIEATSHGLAMGRLAGLKFDLAVYTNITKEHLDFHKTWLGVVKAKSLLITKHLKKNGVAVLNQDDRSFKHLSKLTCKKLGYSQKGKADLFANKIKIGLENLKFKVSNRGQKENFELNLIGRHNISNALAATGAILTLGLNLKQIARSLAGFKSVIGRMGVLRKKPFYVIVDFAHTPNGLKQSLKAAAYLKKEADNKLITVFGCAGKRDPYKRYAMGKIAGKLADIAVITAEDPRTESLKEINNEIERGWKDGRIKNHRILRFDYDDKNVA